MLFSTLQTDLAGRRVVVLGDVMLDRFVYGRVSRISPEAPVPVLQIEHESAVLGGAGNVARNIVALGGIAILIGAVGTDGAADEVTALVRETARLEADFVSLLEFRTVQKIRYVCGQQQIMRADIERAGEIPVGLILEKLASALAQADALVLSDYAKGLLTDALVAEAIAMGRARDIPVIVDPKGTHYSRYDGATLLTPNRAEAALATGIVGDDDEATGLAAEALLKLLPHSPAVVITRSERGMTLLRRGEKMLQLPTCARDVFDVSGAGDTVAATLTMMLAAGYAMDAAAQAANSAAGIAVGKRGTAAVGIAELEYGLHAERLHSSEQKVMPVSAAVERTQIWRGRHEKIGFANGCFDLIHPGHISLLAQAKHQCDRLIVGLNTDASVKRLKGESRPVQDEVSRAIVLGSLSMVDLVVLFEEDTPLELIKTLRPDVLIKGQDYTVDKVAGADFVQSYGGRVFLAKLEKGQSTTQTISRIMHD